MGGKHVSMADRQVLPELGFGGGDRMKRLIKIIVLLVVAALVVMGGRKLVMKRRAEHQKEKAVIHYPLPVRVARARKAASARSSGTKK
jgi:hypothetical protein